MAQRYTRYVTRDADGNVSMEGRVVALDKAVQEELLGRDGMIIIVRPAIVRKLGGIFVFNPSVPPEDFDLMEFY